MSVAFSAGSAWAVLHWEVASCYFITPQNMLVMQYTPTYLHPSCPRGIPPVRAVVLTFYGQLCNNASPKHLLASHSLSMPCSANEALGIVDGCTVNLIGARGDSHETQFVVGT